MEIQNQTEAQFKMLHGEPNKQSKTTKACFDVIFKDTHRGFAAKKHGITEQTISTFIRNNEHKHAEKYLYVQKGEPANSE